MDKVARLWDAPIRLLKIRSKENTACELPPLSVSNMLAYSEWGKTNYVTDFFLTLG